MCVSGGVIYPWTPDEMSWYIEPSKGDTNPNLSKIELRTLIVLTFVV